MDAHGFDDRSTNARDEHVAASFESSGAPQWFVFGSGRRQRAFEADSGGRIAIADDGAIHVGGDFGAVSTLVIGGVGEPVAELTQLSRWERRR
jgi:hypothetical protein